MPTVPRFPGQRIPLAPARLPTPAVRPPPAAFGVPFRAVTEEAVGLSQDVQRIVREEIEKTNEDRFLEEERLLTNWEIENILDSRTGIATKRGRDAFDLPETVSKSFDDFTSKRTQGLSNDAQRRAYRDLIVRRRSQVMKLVQGHVGAERENFRRTERAASIETSKERISVLAAAGLTLEDEELAGEFGNIRERVKRRTEGLGSTVFKQELQKEMTDAHMRVINRMHADEKFTLAAQYFEKVKDQIDPDALPRLQKLFKEAGLRDNTLREADRIIAKKKTWRERFDEAKKIKDSTLRVSVESRLDEEQRREDRLQAIDDENLYLNGARRIEDIIRERDVLPREARTLFTIEEWDRFLPTQRTALNQRLKIANGERIQPDEKVWSDLLEVVKNRPQELVAMTKLEFDSRWLLFLSEPMRRRAESIWLAAKTPNVAEREVKYTSEIEKQRRTEVAFRNALDIPLDLPLGNLQQQQLHDFRLRLEQRENALQDEKFRRGEKDTTVTEQERRDLIDIVSKEEVTTQTFFRTRKRLRIGLIESERGDIIVPITEISTEDQLRIKNDLLSAGHDFELGDPKLISLTERILGAARDDNAELVEKLLREGE